MALRAHARRTLDAMATTRDAEAARARARGAAAETARRLEKEAAAAAAKETLLEDFARRMASLAARRAREAYARRALRVPGRESLVSDFPEEPLSLQGEDDARRRKDEDDEASIRAALEEALAAAERLAPPALNAAPERPPANASRRDGDEPTSLSLSLDVSADDLEASFRTARSSPDDGPDDGDAALELETFAPATPKSTSAAARAESARAPESDGYPDSLFRESGETVAETDAAETRAGRLGETNRTRTRTEPEPEPEPEPVSEMLEIPLPVLVERCVSGPSATRARWRRRWWRARSWSTSGWKRTARRARLSAVRRGRLRVGAASASPTRRFAGVRRAGADGWADRLATGFRAPAAALRDALGSARLQSSACDDPMARRWRRARASPRRRRDRRRRRAARTRAFEMPPSASTAQAWWIF